jgi:hypothetical protein
MAPEAIRAYTKGDVRSHIVPCHPSRWETIFHEHKNTHQDLSNHVARKGGLSRSFVHDHASKGGDPIEVFLLAMVWGFGTIGYGPRKVARMLEQPESEDNIRTIVEVTREKGAGAGWSALFTENKVQGLGISFGTKVLYFAGYSTSHELRPLVLDDNVRWSLYDLARGTVPPPGSRVVKEHYLDYLRLAESWAADPTWEQEPDVAEYGLFKLNGRYPTAVVIPASR